ncbi:MAG: tetratricopeptide repeat protein, partial [Armatimonadetes bacterium]|nr:tetratricopeptide repeat protein [Armatimonadota bacterium]
ELGLALGRVHAVQQRFAEAETRFRQVLEAGARADTSARALYELGWLFLDQDQPDVGESHFDRLLQEHPGHLLAADAAFRLGERAYARGRFPQAADRYRIAAAGSGPAAAPAGYKLGWALQQAGDHAGAAGAFARVADRFPKHALALESRVRAAQALIRAGEVAAARRALESVLERMNPGPEEQELLAEARCALAGLLLAASEWPAAREAVAPVARAELGRRGVRAQLLLAEAVRGAEGAGPALVELGRAARLAAPFPDLLAEARFRAAECRVQLGKLREAEATWREILSQFPGTEWAGRSRAKLAEMLPKGADSP